ncbi:MAG TPA: hypothetical protein VF271_08635 [Rhodanobacteraceae bacterium]
MSSAYRQAQRATAAWLELDDAARPARFALPAVWSALDAVEHGRLARWLAWQHVAADTQGNHRLAARIERLDSTLDGVMSRALGQLPGQRTSLRRHLRASA